MDTEPPYSTETSDYTHIIDSASTNEFYEWHALHNIANAAGDAFSAPTSSSAEGLDLPLCSNNLNSTFIFNGAAKPQAPAAQIALWAGAETGDDEIALPCCNAAEQLADLRRENYNLKKKIRSYERELARRLPPPRSADSSVKSGANRERVALNRERDAPNREAVKDRASPTSDTNQFELTEAENAVMAQKMATVAEMLQWHYASTQEDNTTVEPFVYGPGYVYDNKPNGVEINTLEEAQEHGKIQLRSEYMYVAPSHFVQQAIGYEQFRHVTEKNLIDCLYDFANSVRLQLGFSDKELSTTKKTPSFVPDGKQSRLFGLLISPRLWQQLLSRFDEKMYAGATRAVDVESLTPRQNKSNMFMKRFNVPGDKYDSAKAVPRILHGARLDYLRDVDHVDAKLSRCASGFIQCAVNGRQCQRVLEFRDFVQQTPFNLDAYRQRALDLRLHEIDGGPKLSFTECFYKTREGKTLMEPLPFAPHGVTETVEEKNGNEGRQPLLMFMRESVGAVTVSVQRASAASQDDDNDDDDDYDDGLSDSDEVIIEGRHPFVVQRIISRDELTSVEHEEEEEEEYRPQEELQEEPQEEPPVEEKPLEEAHQQEPMEVVNATVERQVNDLMNLLDFGASEDTSTGVSGHTSTGVSGHTSTGVSAHTSTDMSTGVSIEAFIIGGDGEESLDTETYTDRLSDKEYIDPSVLSMPPPPMPPLPLPPKPSADDKEKQAVEPKAKAKTKAKAKAKRIQVPDVPSTRSMPPRAKKQQCYDRIAERCYTESMRRNAQKRSLASVSMTTSSEDTTEPPTKRSRTP